MDGTSSNTPNRDGYGFRPTYQSETELRLLRFGSPPILARSSRTALTTRTGSYRRCGTTYTYDGIGRTLNPVPRLWGPTPRHDFIRFTKDYLSSRQMLHGDEHWEGR